MNSLFSAVNLTHLSYVLVFGVSALTCFAVINRTEKIEDPDTRRGLFWLLISSGTWASARFIHYSCFRIIFHLINHDYPNNSPGKNLIFPT